jgi:hypothetical protein
MILLSLSETQSEMNDFDRTFPLYPLVPKITIVDPYFFPLSSSV